MIDPKEICFLVTYDENYAELAKYSVYKNISKYCKKHGYFLHVDRQINLDNDRSPSWQKIRQAQSILKQGKFKWLFFMDVDCLIMNSDIKLESLIDEDYSFIVPQHNIKAEDNPITNIPGVQNVITSHFFVKNDEHGLAILQAIWDAEEWPKGMSYQTFDYEGRQTRLLINSLRFKDKIKIIEEKLLNRFWYVNNPFMVMHFKGVNDNVWQPGDFTVHVTGYKKHERIQLLSDLHAFSGLYEKE